MARLDVVYIERGVKEHPRTQEILERVRPRHVIWCEHFGEIFNRKKQDFREQKKAPALILAEKTGRRVLPAPDGYGIGGSRNYYFSHMLNCVFDCRYCFLQGMYPSANYVLFLNFEDFVTDIESTLAEHPGEDVYFYSGYDCDSLALETYSHFVAHYLPFFRRWPRAFVELRTKSVNISPLLKMDPVPNAIVAWSLTPQVVAEAVEAKTPSIEARLKAAQRLQERGWKIGLRFDPLIASGTWQEQYETLLRQCESYLDVANIHSLSYGPMRFPNDMFKKVVKLYPDERLFAGSMVQLGRLTSYPKDLEEEMSSFVGSRLVEVFGKEKLFQCVPEGW